MPITRETYAKWLKYADWLVVLFFPLLISVEILGLRIENDAPDYDICRLAVIASSITLGLTVLLAFMEPWPATDPDPPKEMPRWAKRMIAYAIVCFAAAFLFGWLRSHSSAVWFVYVPSAIFFLNLSFTFLAQNWAAGKRGIPARVALPTHALFAAWTSFAFSHINNKPFIVISFFAVAVAIVLLIAIARRIPNELKQERSD